MLSMSLLNTLEGEAMYIVEHVFGVRCDADSCGAQGLPKQGEIVNS